VQKAAWALFALIGLEVCTVTEGSSAGTTASPSLFLSLLFERLQ
jgi:hypothetical protein